MLCPGPGLENALRRRRKQGDVQPVCLCSLVSAFTSTRLLGVSAQDHTTRLLVQLCGYVLRSVGVLTAGTTERDLKVCHSASPLLTALDEL